MFTANPMDWMSFEESSFYIVEDMNNATAKFLRSVGINESYIIEATADNESKAKAWYIKILEGIKKLIMKAVDTIRNIFTKFNQAVDKKTMEIAGKYIPKLKNDVVFGKVHAFPEYDLFINFTHPICKALRKYATETNDIFMVYNDVNNFSGIEFTDDKTEEIKKRLEAIRSKFNDVVSRYKSGRITGTKLDDIVSGGEVDVTKKYLLNNWDRIKKEVTDFSIVKERTTKLYKTYADIFDISKLNSRNNNLFSWAAVFSRSANELLRSILLAMVNRYKEFTRIARNFVISFGHSTGKSKTMTPDINMKESVESLFDWEV